MSVHSFTPGPWHVGHLGSESTCQCRGICDEGYAGGIATVHVDNGIKMIGEGGNDCPPLAEAVANMHLMAAAPELLACLIETLEIATRNEDGEFADRARRAIAKALGE